MPRRARRVLPLSVRARAAQHLPRGDEAAAGELGRRSISTAATISEPTTFWSLPAGGGGPAASAEEVVETIRTAVRRRLIADVPVGAFLSGGTDSSLVVAAHVRGGGRRAHVLDRLRRPALRRVALRQGRGRAPRHAPHPPAARVARRDGARAVACDELRRAVRGLLGAADARRLAPGARARHGRALRRRRRRAVRRLHALPREPPAAPRGAHAAPGRARRCSGARDVARRAPRSASSARSRRRPTRAACIAKRSRSGARDELARLMPGAGGGRRPWPAFAHERRRADGADDALRRAHLPRRRHPAEGRSRVDVGRAWRRATRCSTPTSWRSRCARSAAPSSARATSRCCARRCAATCPAELVDRPKMGFGVPVGEWMRDGLRPMVEDLVLEPDRDRVRQRRRPRGRRDSICRGGARPATRSGRCSCSSCGATAGCAADGRAPRGRLLHALRRPAARRGDGLDRRRRDAAGPARARAARRAGGASR